MIDRYTPQYLTSPKGYLLVSFLLATILWAVMIGKKDTTLVRNLKVAFVTENGLSVSNDNS